MLPNDTFEWLARMPAIRATTWQSAAAIHAQAQRRFEALVQYAAAHSPYYRAHYRQHGVSLRNGDVASERLPPVQKAALMRHFDAWVTDPEVNYDQARAFAADPAKIGDYYLERYAVWKSSGTTGEPGLFLHTRKALAVYDALLATRFDWGGSLLPHLLQNPFSMGGPAVLIAATGQHFAGIAAWHRLRRSNPWWWTRTEVVSVLSPVDEWVKALNTAQPSVVSSYATVLTVLADEQSAGRLAIQPSLLWSGGEGLSPQARQRIEAVFGCPVVNDYGASEALSIAFECPHGWLHVNSDWIKLEPIDRLYRPVPPGERSHSVLLTNLANRVQPLIRYDLGDSVLLNPSPCPCGNPLPSIQIEGRRDDILHMRAPSGHMVTLCPMAISTVIEEAAGVHRFQIIQTTHAELALRFEPAVGEDAAAQWQRIAQALRDFLSKQGLASVSIQWERTPPVRDVASGKLRQVLSAGFQPT